MVGMEVGDDHRVDILGIDAGRGEICMVLADRALALLIHAETEPGVDHDEF